MSARTPRSSPTVITYPSHVRSDRRVPTSVSRTRRQQYPAVPGCRTRATMKAGPGPRVRRHPLLANLETQSVVGSSGRPGSGAPRGARRTLRVRPQWRSRYARVDESGTARAVAVASSMSLALTEPRLRAGLGQRWRSRRMRTARPSRVRATPIRLKPSPFIEPLGGPGGHLERFGTLICRAAASSTSARPTPADI
jgi:hypothetical protein